MRKTISTFFFLLVIANGFACSCRPIDFMQRFQFSKFVARAKIISIIEDKSDPDYSIATIQILELFKGSKISSIKVSRGGCALFINANTVWQIFALEKKGKYFAINGCSGCFEIGKKVNKDSYPTITFKHNRQLAMLKCLKSHKIQNSNPNYLEFGYDSDCFKSFKGYSLKQTFAIYEIEVSENLAVKKIKPVITFENKNLSKKIMNCMSKDLAVFNRDVKKIKKPIKLLLAFYFFPGEKGNKGDISITDFMVYK